MPAGSSPGLPTLGLAPCLCASLSLCSLKGGTQRYFGRTSDFNNDTGIEVGR